ncbi:hypothetical protein [Oceanobacillus sp. J11TS1]|uniref:hypothetical protein n=1 Tax=Oceanobacillus sp. J11TS1 TaxID=2807191 RepID=UPI001B148067|nr:hypothetical protein [Oceanobacillus sp. J11TS1]GIO22337.1 hypothetical protein J11TS1_09180 [Oceanobacillus sp. J11TS1]
MKKRYVVSALGVVGAGVASILLSDRKNRKDVKSTADTLRVFENAGKPDESTDMELDQLENAKMVSEGSQFGVQYYNENKDKISKDLKKN